MIEHLGLTHGERRVLTLLADAWNEFLAIGVIHPDDATEFRQAIHCCQNIMAWRVARRVDPDAWR